MVDIRAAHVLAVPVRSFHGSTIIGVLEVAPSSASNSAPSADEEADGFRGWGPTKGDSFMAAALNALRLVLDLLSPTVERALQEADRELQEGKGPSLSVVTTIRTPPTSP